ncbi:hypothetical protein [Rhizobium sp. R693]|uniref:hypothetical protein n=1 Tax=Rhizobium sp. R693 TaxID=1764276 RepID=UPI001FD9F84A|nr:hypothetical protein [Rhizobium sp. R693]
MADALNSLSIEGHEVSEELIRRVQDGQWQPDEDAQDYEARNALAAKGYRLAFEEVREDIRKILEGGANWRIARGKAPGLVPGHVQPFGDRGHHQGAPAGRLPIAQCPPAGLVACPFAATCNR